MTCGFLGSRVPAVFLQDWRIFRGWPVVLVQAAGIQAIVEQMYYSIFNAR